MTDPDALLLEKPRPSLAEAKTAEDAGDEEPNPQDYMCGLLSWRPPWLQRAADIRVFTFVLSTMNLCSGLHLIYYTAVITQIEKRFGLTSSITGFLKNADNIGFFLTIIIVSHFCRHSNKPRLFAIATVLNAFSVLIFAVPHFIYGGGGQDFGSGHSDLGNGSVMGEDTAMFCSAGPVSEASTEERCRSSGGGLFTYNGVAVAIFTVASILQGMANSPTVALGITYLDDNARDESPKYLGFMFAVRALAPILAFLLGAWTNSKFVDLSDPGIDQRDPRWIGAWWLGFIICAGLVLVSAGPVVFFPPRLDKTAPVVKDKGLLANAKDLPYALLRLVRNRLYMVVLIAVCLDIYIMGFMTFLPKYIELHFGKTASFASLLTGIIMALAWSTGPIVSGRLIGSRKISPFTTMKIIVIISFISVGGFIVLMFLGCSRQEWEGPIEKFRSPIPVLSCSSNCSCDSRLFSPVCGSDGVNYVSACYAGCSGTTTINTTSVLSDCRCVAPPGDGTANFGRCDLHCGTMLIAYAVVLFLTSFVTSMYIIPAFTTVMRCVSYKDKALSIALATATMQVLVFPAPIVYGLGIDGTCLLHDTSCSAEGACVVYHNNKFRFRLHGLTIILKGLATIMYCIGLVFSRKAIYSDSEQDTKRDVTEAGAGDEEMKALADSPNGVPA